MSDTSEIGLATTVGLLMRQARGANANLRSLIFSVSRQASKCRSLLKLPTWHSGISLPLRRSVRAAFSFSLPAHLSVVRALSLPRVETLGNFRPGFAYRYLGHYLAHGFCAKSRAAILANHYNFLNSHMDEGFVRRICEDQVVLWEEFRAPSRYSIALMCPRNSNFEGDLSLVFQEDSSTLFTLSFSFAPGTLIDVGDSQVLFVSLLQGTRGKFDSIRRATKSLGDIAPPALLLSAAEALAASLGVSAIVGVGSRAQISVAGKHEDNQHVFAYDDFWLSLGARTLNDRFFHLTTFQEEKPLSSIKSNHRSRVKRKREFKSALAEQVGRTFRQSCLH